MAPEAAAAVAASPEGRRASKGVLLAIAIILLWLAGLCFFIALEGSQLLTEATGTTGGGLVKGFLSGIASKAQAQGSDGSGSG